MSADAAPISNTRFAEALTSLPLGNLHAKAAELRNAVAHLLSSNDQLKPYADEGDRDCTDAIAENIVVIRRMEERIGLLKQEVEGRGYKWDDMADVADGGDGRNGHLVNGHAGSGEGAEEEREDHNVPRGASDGGAGRPRLTDEELARRLREQVEDDMDEQDGVHL